VEVVIIVLGVLGLAAAGVFFNGLVVDGARRRQYLDIVIAVAVVVTTVLLLFFYGDSLLQ
jgi:hypothetical protein